MTKQTPMSSDEANADEVASDETNAEPGGEAGARRRMRQSEKRVRLERFKEKDCR